jgi:hypothetical protein
MLNTLTKLYPKVPKESFYDNRVPKFELDEYPAGCDVEKCKERLNGMYESTRSVKLYYYYLRTDEYKPDDFEYAKRLGVYTAKTWEWYTNDRTGGNINKNFVDIPYDPHILHSYLNEPISSEVLRSGTTHVSVGFTDLGVFHYVDGSEDWTASRPLKWVGYEASAYCVAKTAVIVAMIEIGADWGQVMQVWYSAAWSCDTLKAFKDAIMYLNNSK